MISLKFKKNLLMTLLTLAVILLAVNIYFQQNDTNINPEEFDLKEKDFTQQFQNILEEFGIKKSLVKESKSLNKNLGYEISNFKVQVPKDLTIPEILSEVYNTFRQDSLTINSTEKVKNGKTTLTLKFKNVLLLSAEFEYSKTYSRNKGFIALIIYDVDLESGDTEYLFESPLKVNILVRPESNIKKNLDLILKSGQQYSVLIDDEITEQKYKLGPNFSEHRVINVVKTLVTDFKNSVGFIIDEKSDFFKSQNYEVLKRELEKRKIKLFTYSDFYYMEFDDNLTINFNSKINELNDGGSIVFIMNQESLKALNEEILKFKRKGFRDVASSLILISE
jgi:hypothetical protein